MVQILVRHGARYPGKAAQLSIKDTIRKIQVANKKGTLKGKYEFLNNFVYNPEKVALETTFGVEQTKKSGRRFYKIYESLAKDNQPFTRSSGKERINDSAEEFLQGFNEAKGIALSPPDAPFTSRKEDTSDFIDVEFQSKKAGVLNPLQYSGCAAFEKTRRTRPISQEVWSRIFIPRIKHRLREELQGAKLDTTDVINLMNLCPFESVSSPEFDQGYLSPFCGLFSKDEWRDYDYMYSVGKWYSLGAGSFLGPTQGVGFSNELLARLRNEPVNDHTSTNQEINRDKKNFPLGRKIYADFSGDGQISTILAALGLYNATKSLSHFKRQGPTITKGFAASYTVPFAARTYFEKIECKKQKEPWVRVIVNDRIIPLSFCPRDDYGRCPLNIFYDKLDFVRNGGHWSICSSKFWRHFQRLKLW